MGARLRDVVGPEAPVEAERAVERAEDGVLRLGEARHARRVYVGACTLADRRAGAGRRAATTSSAERASSSARAATTTSSPARARHAGRARALVLRGDAALRWRAGAPRSVGRLPAMPRTGDRWRSAPTARPTAALKFSDAGEAREPAGRRRTARLDVERADAGALRRAAARRSSRSRAPPSASPPSRSRRRRSRSAATRRGVMRRHGAEPRREVRRGRAADVGPGDRRAGEPPGPEAPARRAAPRRRPRGRAAPGDPSRCDAGEAAAAAPRRAGPS